MALDTTVAGAASNSYLSVAEADGLMASELGAFAQKWRESTDEEKEAALLRATREIDRYVGVVLSRYNEGVTGVPRQRLLFPRSGDLDPVTSQPLIVDDVKWATVLQAAYLITNAETLDQAASFRARGLSNFQNPDGTGGQLGSDTLGAMNPRAVAFIQSVVEGSTIVKIVTT